MFFKRNEDVKKDRDRLLKEVEKLTIEAAKLKHEYKLADEDVRHMIRIKEEQLAVEQEKKAIELERKTQEEIAKAKDLYRDKLETHLNEQIKNIRGMYDEILKRLPDVNVRLKGDV